MLLLVGKALLERPPGVTQPRDARRHPRWRHREQNRGAIHPVDLRHHRVKATRGDLLEAQVLLARFLKQLNRPAEPISHNDLACRSSHVMAGEIRAATTRSFPRLCTHQWALPSVAQIPPRGSGAKLPSLTLRPSRCETKGLPLEPARIAQARGNVPPRLRRGGLRASVADFTLRGCPRAILKCQGWAAMACCLFFLS
jgi:hypothetical protein